MKLIYQNLPGRETCPGTDYASFQGCPEIVPDINTPLLCIPAACSILVKQHKEGKQ
jgi:hypothetical protein